MRTIIQLLSTILIACALGSGCSRGHTQETRTQNTNTAATTGRDQASPVATTGVSTAPADHDQVVTTNLFRNIVKRENPVVVSITTQSRLNRPDSEQFSGGDDFFRRFFGAPAPPQAQVQHALGSGFIISPDGEILTNNHVVAGADQIRVGLLSDEHRSYDATVVGRDPLTDSALIKLQNGPGNLPTADLGDSDALEPGDWVVAIGNPFRLGHTVTVGVVSYKARPFTVSEGRVQNMLQTDASINPGNSGGPLIDVHGAVIGINSAILAGEDGQGNIGIGFAVPINTVKTLLPQLRQGRVHRARLGIQVQTPPITEDDAKSLGLPKPEGAIVASVEHDSPAEHAGLRAGDVIVEYNGNPVSNGGQLTEMVVSTPVGTKVSIAFFRNGQRQTTTATVEELNVEGNQNQREAGRGSTSGYGISLGDLTPDIARELQLPAGASGALIEQVQPFTPAAEAGLQRGDVIVEINRQPVHSASDASRLLEQVKSGQSAFLLVSRRGNRVFVQMERG